MPSKNVLLCFHIYAPNGNLLTLSTTEVNFIKIIRNTFDQRLSKNYIKCMFELNDTIIFVHPLFFIVCLLLFGYFLLLSISLSCGRKTVVSNDFLKCTINEFWLHNGHVGNM